MDGVVGVESESEEEESSSSSDEMIFDPRQKSALYSDMDQSAADDERPLYSSRLSDLSMPGSIILENSDTPPPFRKRTLPVTEQDKHRRPGGVSPRLALKEDVNGQTEREFEPRLNQFRNFSLAYSRVVLLTNGEPLPCVKMETIQKCLTSAFCSC